jgi:hypothetical protein
VTLPEGWTDDELEAAVSAYKQMLELQALGMPYNKSAFRNRLLKGALKTRTGASIEFRMRNISSVLSESNKQYLAGYLPAKNTGEAIRRRILELLQPDEHKLNATPAVPPMIFFNVGWMENYAGTHPSDLTLGRHKYLEGRSHGAESFNFVPYDQNVYGFRPGTKRNVQIGNLGAEKSAESISGVLVVWIAMEPISKKAFIVGWYENATVYRQAQTSPVSSNEQSGMSVRYTAKALQRDALLLPLINRDFWVQSNKTMEGGFGQSVVWYGRDEEYRKRVWRYVQSVRNARSKSSEVKRNGSRPPRNDDPELRRKVEKAAIKHATDYFSSELGGNFDVVSVETQAKGWDLEAIRDSEKLHVEVKGLLGAQGICELTPNEYQKSNHEEFQSSYVIYVVNNAVSETPIASIFRYDANVAKWKTLDGRELEVIVRPAAVLKFST